MIRQLTTDQRKTIFKLLPALLKTDCQQRSLMVARYTKDPAKKSVNDLTFDQANEVIKNYGGKPFKIENWAMFDYTNAQHRKVLSVCHVLDWTIYDTDKQKWLVNVNTLSDWLKSKRSPVNKPLNKMNPEELSKVIFALERIFEKQF